MANSPLQKIVTASQGRGAQLEYGPGNNQYARASDFNPVVDYVNDRSSINKGVVTQGTSVNTGVTLNAIVGTITMFAGTITNAAPAVFVLTNSNITSTSIVYATVSSLGTAAAGSMPVVASVVPSNGSASITVANTTATATGANSIQISFVVF